ncbi:MAG TPA: hypothetical protein VJ935_08950 [Acidimicrobiia bacterium]|nr:hypothetical protein [Acidimicrobiia bacterium]
MRSWFARELAKPVAVLVPLRLFIGVGWLRAFFEKVGDSAWWNGSAVTDFLVQQMDQGLVVFPFYQRIIETTLRPGGRWVGWLVISLQLVIGLAILTGTYTNLALIIGASLNLTFMLAGRITPSVFYIAIQTLLFVTEAGTAFGVDGELDRRSSRQQPSLALAARLPHRGSIAKDVSDVTILAIVAGLFSLLGFVHASDFGPGGIDDPGLVLGAVMAMSAMTLAIYAGGLFIRERWRRETNSHEYSQLKGSAPPSV